jgi:O-antigen/teichoic acid export membrane protein
MRAILNALLGSGVFARAVRSAGWTTFGFAASQVIRLGANLIFARLLFPEAFGLMALVTVFIVGLGMFSDIGLGPSIMQNKRGDDPDFLNTAWTIQIIRGICLWLGTCAIALPVANFYGEPMLAQFLPVAGLVFLIGAFNPTRIETAGRHLLIGRVVMLDLASNIIGTAVMIILAWATRSVWALVVGSVVNGAAKLVLTSLFLPGPANRLQWDRSSVRELITFGKWIFFSTAAYFLISQADKAILGKYLSLELLGIYSIGYFLANFPLHLGVAINARILIPLYRDRSPATSPENFRNMRLMRFALSGGMLTLVMAMAFLGNALVHFLYDPRYAAAGAIVVLIASIHIPQQVIGLTYDQAALAAGDSRRFFYVVAIKATLLTAAFLIGAEMGGLFGALIGQSVAMLFIYPLHVWLAWLHGAWDPLHDAICAAVSLCFVSLALWYNWEAIAALAAITKI